MGGNIILKKATLVIYGAIIVSLMLLQGCVDKDNKVGTTKLDAVVTMPEQMTKGRMISLPTRQQSIYKNEDGTLHVVLEVIKKDADVINVDSKESIKIGNRDGVVYVYNGEDIDYQNLSEAEVSGIVKPQEEDTIIEWKLKKRHLRLYGNLSKEELIEMAEGVMVK